MNKFTAQAPSVEEAITIALNVLNVSKKEADIVIEDEGRKGFLGLGQKDAIVTVTAHESIESSVKDMDFVSDLKENHLKEKEAATLTPSSAKEDKAEDDAQENEVKGVAVHREENVQDTPSPKEGEEAEIDETDEEIDDEQPEDDPRAEINPLSDEKAIEAVVQYIKTIAKHLGVDDVEVEVYRELDNVYFDISSDKPGIIIGRHGKVLDAIHTLSQIYLRNHASSKLYARLDSENYRGRREESLKSLAERSAEKVIQTKQAEILEAMPAKERKIIHHILSDNKAVKTHSEGEEPNRYLVIEPADL